MCGRRRLSIVDKIGPVVKELQPGASSDRPGRPWSRRGGSLAAAVLRLRRLGYDTPGRAREALWGYLFVLPWLIGLLAFTAGPIVASFALSLSKYDVIRSPELVGPANYLRAFFEDELFWGSLGRTFRYAILAVPLGLAGSLVLAVLLNRGLRGTLVFRTLYFMPHLTPAVAAAILWTWLLHPEVGPVNYLLASVGMGKPGWFASPQWALPSIVMVSLWTYWGGNNMLIFLAGLQGVPQELYDAAEVDGAGPWTRFRHVTVPLISPTIFFNLILGVIGALKVFSLAFVATQGGPAWATWFYALHIYRWAFEYFEMGYASALAWIFVAILLAFTLVQIRLARRWVYYAGGS
jgi:multiple sugar transport system permease protein